MDLGLDGRTALVLGASAGLGRASAIALAAEGARVVAVARNSARLTALPASADDSTGEGLRGEIVAVPADLTAPDAAPSVVDAATTAIGAPQIVVLNAPGPPPGRADYTDAPALDDAWRNIVVLAHAVITHTLPGMRSTGWGRILAIGSSGMLTPIPGLAASNTARAALASYFKTLAGEVAGDGVTVNIVVPGRIDTDRVRALDAARAHREDRDTDHVRAASQAEIPAGRYGSPEQYAAAIAFLAGNQAGYITGATLRCDGGLVPTL